jgi:spermidine synthase
MQDTSKFGTLVESKESPYNNIYVYRKGPYLSMTFGLNQGIYTESRYNTADERELPVPYTPFMTASLMYPSKVYSILEIGSGGGRIAWYLHKFLPKAQITSVELDPAVADFAVKYFGVHEEPNFHLVTADGRIFLAQSKEKYDVILIDAYRGPFVPFHLLTEEFYRAVQDHLAAGGVVAQNVVPSTMLFDSAVKTINRVFPQVEFYEASGTGHSPLTGEDVGGNVVIVAYNGQLRSVGDLQQSAEARQAQYGLRYELKKMLPVRYLLKTVFVAGVAHLDVFNSSGIGTGGIMDDAKVLTDDFAPVESLNAIARHNQKRSEQR